MSPAEPSNGTTTAAQPGTMSSSMSASIRQELSSSFMNWLIRLYSTRSGDSTRVHSIYSPSNAIRLQAFPPTARFTTGQTKAASSSVQPAAFISLPFTRLRLPSFGYVISTFI